MAAKKLPNHRLEWVAAFESILDLWCMDWPEPDQAHAMAEFLSWMRACDTADSQLLTAYTDYVARCLNNARTGRWDLDAGRRAYVMVREQFYGYAATTYQRRFPIHGPWPEEDDDLPF